MLEEEYLERLRRFTPVEVAVVRNADMADAAAAREDESRRLQQKIPESSIVLVLDERGEQWGSRDLAQWLEKQAASGSRALTVVIGGAHGLNESLREDADRILALSRMTWTHEMSRVMVLEQLYRAFSIMQGHPYHK